MEESSQDFDLTDVLIGVGLFATFVAFAVCIWLLHREFSKKKANQKDSPE